MLASLLVAATVALGPPQPPFWDRARVIETLEQLAAAGQPEHLDHDEGQELWTALAPMLSDANDADLRRASTRAAIPLVARVLRPVVAIDELPAIEIHADRVLPLPWPVAYTAEVEFRVDRGAWRRLARLRSGGAPDSTIGRLIPRSGRRPGIHTIELRARIRYAPVPDALDTEEVRDLAPVSYGVWDPARMHGQAGSLEAVLARARNVTLGALQPGLPETPLAAWLAQFASHAMWRTNWCSWFTRPSGVDVAPADVCAVAMAASAEQAFTEIWIKVGELRTDADGGRWSDLPPVLVGSYLHGPGNAVVPLASIPELLETPADMWPAPHVAVSPADISATPAAPPPGEATTVQVRVVNRGSAPIHGVTIDVMVGSTEDQLILHRQFVRDIDPGDRVEISFAVTLPAGYGWVELMAMALSDHVPWPPIGEFRDGLAFRLINRPAMPPAVLAAICQHAAARGPCEK